MEIIKYTTNIISYYYKPMALKLVWESRMD